jgi:hypothetical protein
VVIEEGALRVRVAALRGRTARHYVANKPGRGYSPRRSLYGRK